METTRTSQGAESFPPSGDGHAKKVSLLSQGPAQQHRTAAPGTADAENKDPADCG